MAQFRPSLCIYAKPIHILAQLILIYATLSVFLKSKISASDMTQLGELLSDRYKPWDMSPSTTESCV